MKKILLLTFALVLASCAPVAPTAQPAAVIPPTPVVLVATVLVPVVQTQIVQPTIAPTSLPTQTPQVIVVTATGGATPSPAAANPPVSGNATATLPPHAGGLIFQNLTRSSDIMYFRCQPKDITFGISTDNPSVVEVDFYYRIQDRLTSVLTISGWKNAGAMKTDKNGNFTIDFLSEMVNADLRSRKAWFDYQFIGINKLGDVVGRSDIIAQQITYKIDCSD